ncbi:MAG: SoxR reducing system RseC family protein [Candidatus Omnitrophica bacterium]|nr:SoxR reducing system RseC family protein [Candidatus Omnitrophota bacterium]MCK5492885.1 SoxR reducing system RseC family protein [Candidatus Omnitrophota bacterium]
MFKEIVEVDTVFSDKVKIKFLKNGMCDCCKMDSMCGKGNNRLMIDDCGFKLYKNDKIEIAIEERKTILASLIIFFVPGFLFISGLIIFKNRGELESFFLALGVISVYYMFVKITLKKYGKKFNLKILRKI